MACPEACTKYKLASLFGAKSIVKKLIIIMQLSLVQLLQKYNLHP